MTRYFIETKDHVVYEISDSYLADENRKSNISNAIKGHHGMALAKWLYNCQTIWQSNDIRFKVLNNKETIISCRSVLNLWSE